MEKPALKVEDISIRFNLSKEKVDNLKELLIKKIKGETIRFNEFWALKNINFELPQCRCTGCCMRRTQKRCSW